MANQTTTVLPIINEMKVSLLTDGIVFIAIKKIDKDRHVPVNTRYAFFIRKNKQIELINF